MTSAQNALSEVNIGLPAPDFAYNLDGKPVSLKKLSGGRKALLIFYRGGCTGTTTGRGRHFKRRRSRRRE